VVIYGTGGTGGGQAVVADVNSDGNPDIVVASPCGNGLCRTSGLVGVLFGNGDGTFQRAITYGSGGWEAFGVTVGDVNGDDKPDIVVANSCPSIDTCPTGGIVGVLLNNGDGTFQTAETYGSGNYKAISVVLADLNGDGKPDILVSNISEFGANGTLGVLLNNGDGTFQTAVSYGSGGYGGPISVAVADVNGDGKPDLVAANECVSESGCGEATSTGGMGVLINTSSCDGQYGVDAPISLDPGVRKPQGLGGFAAECFY
jgi:FG-GAP-like repeat